MIEIVGAIARVSAIMNEIAAALAEQSTGIDQVNSAVTQMDEVTQQNAALVEQAAAAAQSMAEQAQALREAVADFQGRRPRIGTRFWRETISEIRSSLMGWTPQPEAASMCQSGCVEATT
jgi:uncharacterized phage infection (PIP) family protein YhgE